MWKQKDKQATIENQKNMLIHRKRKVRQIKEAIVPYRLTASFFYSARLRKDQQETPSKNTIETKQLIPLYSENFKVREINDSSAAGFSHPIAVA